MKDNIFKIVEDKLKQNESYISEDGKILKTKVYADVMTMNEELIKCLLEDEKIKVSVVVPNYNYARFLNERILLLFFETGSTEILLILLYRILFLPDTSAPPARLRQTPGMYNRRTSMPHRCKSVFPSEFYNLHPASVPGNVH